MCVLKCNSIGTYKPLFLYEFKSASSCAHQHTSLQNWMAHTLLKLPDSVPLLCLQSSLTWNASGKFMGSNLPQNQTIYAAENDNVLHHSWYITEEDHFLGTTHKTLEICIQFCPQAAWANQILSYFEMDHAQENSSHCRELKFIWPGKGGSRSSFKNYLNFHEKSPWQGDYFFLFA